MKLVKRCLAHDTHRAVEPVMGHMKSDHRLRRCMLRGGLGDALNMIGSASGFNIRKILRLLASGILSRALLVWCMVERFLGVILYRFYSTLPIKQIKY